jgi:hypothetical protein
MIFFKKTKLKKKRAGTCPAGHHGASEPRYCDVLLDFFYATTAMAHGRSRTAAGYATHHPPGAARSDVSKAPANCISH